MDSQTEATELYLSGVPAGEVVSTVKLSNGARYTVLKPGPMHLPDDKKFNRGTQVTSKQRKAWADKRRALKEAK